jgi:hypothetical protein
MAFALRQDLPAAAAVVQSLGEELSRSVILVSKTATDDDGAVIGVIIDSVSLRGRHSSQDLANANAILVRSAMPAPKKPVISALAELKLLTRRRSEDEGEIGLTLMAYEKRLAEYPGVVVLDAIRRLGDGSRWFPSWSEVKGMCDAEVHRLAAVAALLEMAHLQALAREELGCEVVA